jgi:hypothetical protein
MRLRKPVSGTDRVRQTRDSELELLRAGGATNLRRVSCLNDFGHENGGI